MVSDNEINAKKFLNVINSQYHILYKKWRQYCNQIDIMFDEDIYNETILKCYDYIISNNINDSTEKGMVDYFFKAFINNIKRDKQYARNQNRDEVTDIMAFLDSQIDDNDELFYKKKKEYFNSFMKQYILNYAGNNFDMVSFYCFRLYYLIPKMNYQKLKELTKIMDCKKRVVAIKKYIQDNINKNDIYKEFLLKFPEFEE